MGNTESIHKKAYLGDIQAVEEYLKDGGDINAIDDENKSLFMISIYTCNMQLTQLLLDHHVDIRHESNKLALFQACAIGNYQHVEILLNNNISPNDFPSYSAISWAHLEIVQLLIERGADINQEDEFGRFPIERALFSIRNTKNRLPEKYKIIEYLISSGCNLNIPNIQHRTYMLSCIILWGNKRILLLALQYRIEIPDPFEVMGKKYRHQDRKEIHMRLFFTKNINILKIFISRGIKLTYVDNYGQTLLHYAAEKCKNLELILFLLDNGLDLNAKDFIGLSVLHYAACNKNGEEIVKWLIEKGLDVYHKNIYDDYPISGVVSHNNDKILKIFIDHMPDYDFHDLINNTSFGMINFYKSYDALEILNIIHNNHHRYNLTLQQRCYLTCIINNLNFTFIPRYIIEVNMKWLFTTDNELEIIDIAKRKII